MTGLLRADFRKFLKDKLFLVLIILGVVFAVITPLLYMALLHMVGDMADPMTEEMLAGSFNAKSQFFASFTFGNNLGLIAPLLVGVILYKDFGSGTVRNKIISGHSRYAIFSSMFTVCLTMLFGIILAHALLTLAISLPFFEYQDTPFVAADWWYLLESLLFELLVYLFVSALITWLCATRKNIGMVIVLYIAFIFVCMMIAGIVQGVMLVLQMEPGMEKTVDILNFFQRINVFNSSASIGLGTAYTAEDVWYYTLPPIIGTVALLGHGLLKFNRQDLK